MKMKRYKVLVTGKNSLIIDNIFLKLGDAFEIVSSSNRYVDRFRHIEFYRPDLFIICLNDESAEEMASLAELKRMLTSYDVVTVVIGREEECEAFEKHAVQVADLILTRPINVERIRAEVMSVMQYHDSVKEEQVELMATLAEVKASDKKKHVLVVDDDPLMLKVVKEYLGDDYQVATAINGKVAMKFLETKETNIILLDYEMPGESGKDVLLKIKNNEKLANVPVIFLTGVTDKDKLMEVLKLKPQGYLLKPVEREKLLGTIEKFIG